MTEDSPDLESRLRGYRPAEPAADLRARVLEAAAREASRATAPAWTVWAAAAAAIVFLAGGAWTQMSARRLDAEVTQQVQPHAETRAREDELVRFYGDTPDVRALARVLAAQDARESQHDRTERLRGGGLP